MSLLAQGIVSVARVCRMPTIGALLARKGLTGS